MDVKLRGIYVCKDVLGGFTWFPNITFDCVRGCSKGYHLDQATYACARCPPGTYQDEPLQAYCKRCPEDFSSYKDGITERRFCYPRHTWSKNKSIKTLLKVLVTIVLVGTVAIYFRGTVKNEVTPQAAREEVLEADTGFLITEDSRIIWDNIRASGDFSKMTTLPAKKVEEETEGNWINRFMSRLPWEPAPKTAAARKSLAKERMRMTMTANMLRQSAYIGRNSIEKEALLKLIKNEEDKEERAASVSHTSAKKSHVTNELPDPNKVDNEQRNLALLNKSMTDLSSLAGSNVDPTDYRGGLDHSVLDGSGVDVSLHSPSSSLREQDNEIRRQTLDDDLV
ncbi:hypothetical protein EGW08_006452 [Elysia chlorotica]|uniref:Tyrosine-protein kinase ephrin type A/B receptor-like domain-containing protein n=1 Tax=Elysia chlorotica TaxID=188477 RepID=A0A433TW69_ELYCH|nr:hypothetical protein EGW08_006452 [Elysia chlorotica]